MKPQEKTPQRECLFSQRLKEEGEEYFVALYRMEDRYFLVASEEKGGDAEVPLSADDARQLLAALKRALEP
jgi:hypothetical protein